MGRKLTIGSIGLFVKAKRQEALISQKQLAEKACLSWRTIENAECERMVHLSTCKLILNALGTNMEELEAFRRSQAEINAKSDPVISTADELIDTQPKNTFILKQLLKFPKFKNKIPSSST